MVAFFFLCDAKLHLILMEERKQCENNDCHLFNSSN